MQMQNPLSGFRSFIRNVAPLASHLHACIIEQIAPQQSSSLYPTFYDSRRKAIIEQLCLEIKAAVAELNETHFLPDLALPRPRTKEWSQITDPIYWIKLLSASRMEASIFGFKNAGSSIPLHDHVNMYAFMRVLRGRVRVASFSLLEEDELKKFSRIQTASKTPARYEGVLELSPADGSLGVLSPKSHNLHMVMALEDNTAFIDFFVPGYQHNDCNYYSLSLSTNFVERKATSYDENVLSKLKVGQLYWLNKTKEPSDLQMQTLSNDCASYFFR